LLQLASIVKIKTLDKDAVVELRWGPRGLGQPERPGGPRKTSVLREFKGPVKAPPPEIAR